MQQQNLLLFSRQLSLNYVEFKFMNSHFILQNLRMTSKYFLYLTKG